MSSDNEQLIALADDYQRLYARLGDGADTPEELDALLAEFTIAERDVGAAMEQLARMDLMMRGKIAEAALVVSEAQAGKGLWVRRHEGLRRYLLLLLQRADIENVKTLVGTVYRSSHPHVVVDNLMEVPDELTKIESKPKTREIGEVLKAGGTVPGAHLEYSESVGIRTGETHGASRTADDDGA